MNEPGVILAVDRNPRNLALLSSYLERQGYRVRPVASYEELDRALHGAGPPALALVDLAGFDGGIWERCERLHAAGVPIIVVSPKQSATTQQEGRLHGARAVLTRPLILKQLLGLIQGLSPG
jgi:DNA-binding response OmpR family regulator